MLTLGVSYVFHLIEFHVLVCFPLSEVSKVTVPAQSSPPPEGPLYPVVVGGGLGGALALLLLGTGILKCIYRRRTPQDDLETIGKQDLHKDNDPI